MTSFNLIIGRKIITMSFHVTLISPIDYVDNVGFAPQG